MKKAKSTRTLSLLLALLLMISSVLTGCGNSADTPSDPGKTSEAAQASDDSSASADDEAEKVDTVSGYDGKGETLVVGVQTNSFIEDYENNYFTQMLEKDLNINIEVYTLPADGTELQTKLSLMATGGEDMPDVIVGGLSKAIVDDYGNKGIFIPLNEYLENEEMSSHFLAIPEEHRNQMLVASTAPDGNIYGLTNYGINLWNRCCYRLFINKAWLDVLGMEIPTTTDELYDVLKAFVNEDPNGNGQKDEMGVYGITGGWATNSIWTLMNSFVFYNAGEQNSGLALAEDGKTVIAPFATDEWREGLEYLNMLCEEGLLEESVFTDDSTQFKAIVNAETPVVGLMVAGSLSNWTDVANNPNYAQMELIAPLIGPGGESYSPINSYTPAMQYFITSECENPELAYALGEYFYDWDVTMTNRNGEKELHWTDNEEVCSQYTSVYVEAGLSDRVAIVTRYKTDVDTWSTANSVTWHNVGPGYMGDSLSSADALVDPADALNTPQSLAEIKHIEHYSKFADLKLLPALAYTVEETEKITMPSTDIQEFVKTSTAEFVTGQRELDDAGWDAYLKALESYGLKDLIDVSQAAYDRVAR